MYVLEADLTACALRSSMNGAIRTTSPKRPELHYRHRAALYIYIFIDTSAKKEKLLMSQSNHEPPAYSKRDSILSLILLSSLEEIRCDQSSLAW